MPTRPKRPCNHPACPNLGCTDPAHVHRNSRQYDRSRGNAASRGYDSAWSRFAARYRDANPLCAIAKREGRVEAAEHVDHIIPLDIWRGGKFDGANLQPLSNSAHSAKTRHEHQRNKRGELLAGWPDVPWQGDLTLDEAHEFIRARQVGVVDWLSV